MKKFFVIVLVLLGLGAAQANAQQWGGRHYHQGPVVNGNMVGIAAILTAGNIVTTAITGGNGNQAGCGEFITARDQDGNILIMKMVNGQLVVVKKIRRQTQQMAARRPMPPQGGGRVIYPNNQKHHFRRPQAWPVNGY